MYFSANTYIICNMLCCCEQTITSKVGTFMHSYNMLEFLTVQGETSLWQNETFTSKNSSFCFWHEEKLHLAKACVRPGSLGPAGSADHVTRIKH